MEPRYNPADPPQAETQEGIQAETQEGIQAGTQEGTRAETQAGTQEVPREAETSLMGSEQWVNSPPSSRGNDRTLNAS